VGRWFHQLGVAAREAMGPERFLALLEQAAREVGRKFPVSSFPRLLSAYPEGILTAEKSYASAHESLWKEFLGTRRELHEAQDQLSRAQAMAGLAELAASMAHEINNPLASVLAVLQLLKGDAAENTRDAGLLGAAEREAQRIAGIVS